MAACAVVFTSAIMALQVATSGMVDRNRRLMREKAIVDVFGLGQGEKMSGAEVLEAVRRRVQGGQALVRTGSGWELRQTAGEEASGPEAIPLLLAYSRDPGPDGKHDPRDLLGYAFPVSGIGFWAPVEGLLAVTPDLSRIIGVVFIEHSETPGLGGRITEKHFRDRFRGLPATRGPDGKTLHIRPGEPPRAGDPAAGRFVQAVTGATGTSSAVERFLNDDLARFRRAAVAAGLGAPAARPGAEAGGGP